MAGGFTTVNGSARNYNEGVTLSVVVTCLMAASCGLILGYDSGISGHNTEYSSLLTFFGQAVLDNKVSEELICFSVGFSTVA
ncbi:hypothetical protein ACP70R_026852 [Stipagrostis hirtigluma subsp. patula]